MEIQNNEQQLLINEVEKFFDDSSIPLDQNPIFAIISGPIASGKTTIRNQQFNQGYVVIDAGEVHLNLNNRTYHGFGVENVQLMNTIGYAIARKALLERRNITMEFCSSMYEDQEHLIRLMKSIGYTTKLHFIHCELEECQQRNISRGAENISVHFSHAYQYEWMLQAIKQIMES